MLKSATMWRIMMAGSIAGWVFSILGLVRPFENEKIKNGWKRIFFSWAFGHPLEMLFALPVGKAAGLSFMHIVFKTMLFGFTWWVPLYLKVFRK